MQIALQVVALMLIAVVVNVPMGYQRQSCKKFSPGWWFYIHISIPLIIFARVKSGLGIQYMPFTLASAVLGQIIGSKIYRKRNDVG
jgi:hypothetical protein